uniref:fibroblast growth factor-binding protein 3 n=1 Tax=Jaculus jaculus TaxID=51337 RepID=UPI001E1B2979|nr:fibroblast growth factor-binding protein 3 [Jaculus jaculus]
MRPPRLALLLLLLLQGGCLLAAARREPGTAGPASGRFVSREQLACSWQLVPGAAGSSELAVRCGGGDAGAGARQHCAYRGEPERCAAYAARRAHFWKQVVGALRRKRRPCLDPAPLRARLCAGRQGYGAELRLVSRASPPPDAGLPGEPGPRVRSRGRPRQPPSAPHPDGKIKTPAGRRKAGPDPARERDMATGPNPDGLDANARLTETYCAEKWHSLCNFFVNFWNG